VQTTVPGSQNLHVFWQFPRDGQAQVGSSLSEKLRRRGVSIALVDSEEALEGCARVHLLLAWAYVGTQNPVSLQTPHLDSNVPAVRGKFTALLRRRTPAAALSTALRPEYEFFNAGINGDTSAGLLKRADLFLACNPQILTVLIGTNDVRKSDALAAYISNLDALLGRLKGRRVAVLSITSPGRRSAKRDQSPSCRVEYGN